MATLASILSEEALLCSGVEVEPSRAANCLPESKRAELLSGEGLRRGHSRSCWLEARTPACSLQKALPGRCASFVCSATGGAPETLAGREDSGGEGGGKRTEQRKAVALVCADTGAPEGSRLPPHLRELAKALY